MTTQPDENQPLVMGEYEFKSRLFVGTGKYASFEEMQAALLISGTDCVTVAVRRVNLDPKAGPSIFESIDRERYTILPNTAGCFDAPSAIRTAQLSREILQTNLVKLEVLGDKKTLLPDPVGTLEATRELVADAFDVMVYTSDDARQCVALEEAGAMAVMPAGSPIGSGQGILNHNNIVLCLDLLKENDPSYPVIVDAGVGSASDVAVAMELGADAVLLNTAIAHAQDPIMMAHAMRKACEAGHQSYQAGRIPKKRYATASSPMEGTISYIPGE